jgi:hypothetical protein
LVLFLTCYEFGVFGCRLETDAAYRVVYPELIDLVEERYDEGISGVRHEASYAVTYVTLKEHEIQAL